MDIKEIETVWLVLSSNLVRITPIHCIWACRQQTSTNYNGYAHVHSYVIERERPISPILKWLQWLPIRWLQVSLLTYKILQSDEPEHLRTLLSDYVTTLDLCLAKRNNLVIQQTKLVTTSRAFSFVALCIWNSFKPNLTSAESKALIHKRLKIYLFSMAY